jgi:hypothetical protein
MTKDKKITDQNIKDCLSAKMSIKKIALKYGVSAYTVLKKIQKIEREDARKDLPDPRAYNGNAFGAINPNFNLVVGDTVMAIEPEISPERRPYKIVAISEAVYVGLNLVHGWKAAFRIQDYMTAHDSHVVRLVNKGGKQDEGF